MDVKQWSAADTLKYPITVSGDDDHYQYFLSVRHQKTYEFSNLWIQMIIKGNGIDTSFKVEVPLFKVDGKPYGKPSGSLCTQTIPVKNLNTFTAKGNYRVNIVQLMRKDPLDGIEDVGLIIDHQ